MNKPRPPDQQAIPGLLKLLRKLAKQKLDQDFANSNLASPGTTKVELQRTMEILKISGVLRPTRVSLVGPKLQIRNSSYNGIPSKEAIERLRRYGHIRFSTESVAVASFAVARSLALRDQVKIDITVGFDDVNGREHMISLDKSSNPADFFIAPDGAFHFNGSKSLDKFSLIMPCFYEDQFLLSKPILSLRPGGKLFYFPTSSAEIMLRFLAKEYSPIAPSEVDQRLMDTFRNIASLVRNATPIEMHAQDLPDQAKRLDEHDLMIAWEPLASGIIKRGGHHGLQKVPHSWFPVVFSLNAHERWTHPEREQLLADFVEVFIAEWEYCQIFPAYAWQLLSDDYEFLYRLGLGAGIDVSPLLPVVALGQGAQYPREGQPGKGPPIVTGHFAAADLRDRPVIFAREPSVYVSYAWGDITEVGRRREALVDELCAAVKAAGRDIGRDKTHMKVGDSIDQFADKIAKAERIIAVLSEKSLNSEICMAQELFRAYRRCDYKRREFQEKVIALVMDDARPLLKDGSSLAMLVMSWTAKARKRRQELNAADPGHRSHDVLVLQDLLEDMCPRMLDMLSALKDILMQRGFDQIMSNRFREVIDRLPPVRS